MQRTLQHATYCQGIGLHSGETMKLTLRPASVDTGIVFVRTDLSGPAAILPARYDRISDTRLCSVLENEYGTRVGTIEHVMAALWGAGIDNAILELNGAEVPIMDGSSEPFLALIEEAGLCVQDRPRYLLVIDEAIEVRDGQSVARIEPNDGFVLDVAIDFSHNAIGAQRAEYDFSDTSFAEALARARTFGFASDVAQLRAAGLARGGSLDNAVLVDEQGIVNAEGLRFSDEFVRHKALDCVGDYFLCGHRLLGRVETSKPGHRINNLLMRAVMANPQSWHLEEDFSGVEITHFPASGVGAARFPRSLHQAEK
ncbi:MAG: UDP-3-O-acyl-N-acetylglucosamine deacetylase [Rickettsiales bacterium]|nr:UDP-3-O-acyl-N-acetylglucosamine deacetylase [Rickettsiales bacterium]